MTLAEQLLGFLDELERNFVDVMFEHGLEFGEANNTLAMLREAEGRLKPDAVVLFDQGVVRWRGGDC